MSPRPSSCRPCPPPPAPSAAVETPLPGRPAGPGPCCRATSCRIGVFLLRLFPRMIALDGQSALSPFRLERLNAHLDALHHGTRVQAAWFTYFVDADALPEGEARTRLLTVLEAKNAAPDDATFWVVPRLGTISPWSSKATDILHGAGFDVRRVERGTAWRVTGMPAADHPAYAAVMGAFCDPMVQSPLGDLSQASGLFLAGEAGPLGRVELGTDARAALSAANKELGLALADRKS